jgi:hypothetical protein
MRACPASAGNPAGSGPEVEVPIEGVAAGVVVGDSLSEPVWPAVEGTKLFMMIFFSEPIVRREQQWFFVKIMD